MPRQIVGLDTDIIVCLSKLQRTDLLHGWKEYDFFITDVNYRELNRPDTRKEIDNLIAAGHVRCQTVKDPEALRHFALLRKRVQPGESCMMAAALVAGGVGLSNDVPAGKAARNYKPPVILGDVGDLLVRAVDADRLTIQDVEALQRRMPALREKVPFPTPLTQATLRAHPCVLKELRQTA